MSKKKKLKIANSSIKKPDIYTNKYAPPKTLGYGNTNIYDEQDKMLNDAGIYSTLQMGLYDRFPSFLGYMALAQMSQDGIVRAGIDLRADEMTRRWIDISYAGEGGGDEVISTLEDSLKKLRVDKVFREASQMCGYYGGCLVYIDVGDISDEELRNPLGSDSDTFAVGSIKGLKIIEPFYIAPARYQAFNPIDKDYFIPQAWLVNGKEIHTSRFLYFAENKMPTLLLPSYNFFGLPVAQTAIEPVIAFEEASKASARMITKYASTIFKTDMNDVLSGGSDNEIQKRIAYFAQYRDNDGVMTIDKDAEDIVLSSHSLGGVTDIVRQLMEIVSAHFGEPAVKMWGISPGGFNATGESDMRSHYDHINAVQERIFREPLQYLMDLIQLNTFGQIDNNVEFTFVPLSDEDEKLQADTQAVKVNSMCALFDRGIISGEEARHVLATDEESGFDDIDEDAEVTPPEDLALPLEESETP
jgi:phage-related protein (TIGR01555 family)